MSKLTSTLKILQILETEAPKTVKVKKLVCELGISDRYIRKLVTELKEVGYNIVSTTGRNGGYKLEDNKDLKNWNITEG